MKRFLATLMLIFAAILVYPQTEGRYQDLVTALRRIAEEKDDVQRLAQYDSLAREFGIATPYGASPITAVFDICGLKTLSMPYNEVLGWWE